MERSPVLGPRLLAALASAMVLFGACSAEGGGEDAGPTTAATESTTTTPEGGDDETTPTTTEPTTTTDDSGGDGGGAPTSDELTAILPVATDVGPGWTETEPSSDSEDDSSFDEQCPAAAELGLNDEDQSDEVHAAFVDAEERQVDITLSPSADEIDDEELADFVDALNDCGTLTETDETGLLTTLDIEATVDATYGDQGVRLQADVALSGGSLTQDVTVTIYALLWRTDTVSVELTATDGVDPTALESVPIDPELLTPLADDLDAQVNDLVG